MLETLKALADPTRLRLAAVLSHGEFTVRELTDILSMGQSRISRHLKILSDVGILMVKRQGTWGYYSLSRTNPLFCEIWPLLSSHLESLPGRSEDLLGIRKILEERRQRSREFFDEHARQWDRLSREVLPTGNYEADLLSAIPSCKSILEIGIGTGALLTSLGEKADIIIGVDNSGAMLEQALQRVREAGLMGVDLRLGDMAHLPLADESVDVVLINMVLHHAAQPTIVLHEIGRVLAPGGVLVIADLLAHDQEWVRERMADQWMGFDRSELLRWLADSDFVAQKFQAVPGQPDEMAVFIQSARKG